MFVSVFVVDGGIIWLFLEKVKLKMQVFYNFLAIIAKKSRFSLHDTGAHVKKSAFSFHEQLFHGLHR